MGLRTGDPQRRARQSEERLDLGLRPRRKIDGVNCSIYIASPRCRWSLRLQVSCLGLRFFHACHSRQSIKKYANARQFALPKKNHLVMPAMTNYH